MILREELEVLRGKIIAQHVAAGQKASGRTMQSMRVEVSEDEGVLFGRQAFGTLETGRKGGRVPMGFHKIIRQWMKDKGIDAAPIPYKTNRPHKYTPEERGAMSLAWFISQKIRKEGTSLFRKGGRADIYSNVIPETTERIMNRFLEVMNARISTIKLNKKMVIK